MPACNGACARAWAAQGKLTQPFVSCDGRLTLIHNGEIYNYQELRTLLHRPHEIRTASDSEVIVHLLEEVYQGDLLEATPARWWPATPSARSRSTTSPTGG